MVREESFCPHVDKEKYSEGQRWTAAHNYFRCLHGTKPMHWAPQVAINARGAAGQCQFSHTDSYSNHPPSAENISFEVDGVDIEYSVESWYKEGEKYKTAPLDEVGHFTAMMWDSNGKIGCGICPDSSKGISFCHYASSPGGATANVFATAGSQSRPDLDPSFMMNIKPKLTDNEEVCCQAAYTGLTDTYPAPASMEQVSQQFFDALDSDGNGYITTEELTHAMSKVSPWLAGLSELGDLEVLAKSNSLTIQEWLKGTKMMADDQKERVIAAMTSITEALNSSIERTVEVFFDALFGDAPDTNRVINGAQLDDIAANISKANGKEDIERLADAVGTDLLTQDEMVGLLKVNSREQAVIIQALRKATNNLLVAKDDPNASKGVVPLYTFAPSTTTGPPTTTGTPVFDTNLGKMVNPASLTDSNTFSFIDDLVPQQGSLPPIGGESCKLDKCQSSGEPWEKKCTWKDCSACKPCTNLPMAQCDAATMQPFADTMTQECQKTLADTLSGVSGIKKFAQKECDCFTALPIGEFEALTALSADKCGFLPAKSLRFDLDVCETLDQGGQAPPVPVEVVVQIPDDITLEEAKENMCKALAKHTGQTLADCRFGPSEENHRRHLKSLIMTLNTTDPKLASNIVNQVKAVASQSEINGIPILGIDAKSVPPPVRASDSNFVAYHRRFVTSQGTHSYSIDSSAMEHGVATVIALLTMLYIM